MVIHNERVYTKTGQLPILIWADEVEDEAMEQAEHLARLPFAYHHIALMPDVHAGYGMPIGGVLATEGVIIPNAVGVDIGCGMIAAKSNIENTLAFRSLLPKIVEDIYNQIPVGFSHRDKAAPKEWLPDLPMGKVVESQKDTLLFQIGTLGGGNHFIEIQKDEDNMVWIMLHSGSRNLGYKVADYYNKEAIKYNRVWYSSVPKDWQLAFLPTSEKVAEDYLVEMNYSVEFALNNRLLMMTIIRNVIKNFVPEFEIIEQYNVPHNYVRLEHHFRKNVWVHRKGAISAREGEIGIIPGAMGRNSYIVRGKGNPNSFTSCSHGAGRVLGRRQAKKELKLKEEREILDSQGIVHNLNQNNLDEAPDAYKDIEQVIQKESDLVEPIVKLSALAVLKG